MCAVHTTDPATYACDPENGLETRIRESSPFFLFHRKANAERWSDAKREFRGPLQCPNSLAHDCAPTAQSIRRKISPQRYSPKGRTEGDFRSSLLTLCLRTSATWSGSGHRADHSLA